MSVLVSLVGKIRLDGVSAIAYKAQSALSRPMHLLYLALSIILLSSAAKLSCSAT